MLPTQLTIKGTTVQSLSQYVQIRKHANQHVRKAMGKEKAVDVFV
ncbi:hypothetical protein SAMN05216597_0638 [Pseudomonas cannabina]|nr:hypothetical protein SAMN05216597_0638 [Pseudomonas cannabina]